MAPAAVTLSRCRCPLPRAAPAAARLAPCWVPYCARASAASQLPPAASSASAVPAGAAGELETMDVGRSTNIRFHETMVDRKEKEMLLGQRGVVLWFTGLSASGKSTVACTLEHMLCQRGHLTALLDGDNIRHGLNCDLGFSASDRTENIRRIGEVARLMSDMGSICITSFISPFRADRDAVRARCSVGDFLEVYMHVPLEVCEARDPKGLYKKARAGQIKNFTGERQLGIDDPYEEPLSPEIILEPYGPDGEMRSPEQLAELVLDHLERQGYLRDPRLRSVTANNAVATRLAGMVASFTSSSL